MEVEKPGGDPEKPGGDPEEPGGEPEMEVDNPGTVPEENPDPMAGALQKYLAHVSHWIGSFDREREWTLEMNQEAVEEDAQRDPTRPVAEEPDLWDEIESGNEDWAEYYDTTNGEPLDPN